jgi:hypothetical protein
MNAKRSYISNVLLGSPVQHILLAHWLCFEILPSIMGSPWFRALGSLLAPSKHASLLLTPREYIQNPPSNISLQRRDDYTCGPGRPCRNGACCGKSGFCGYGNTYCGPGCTSHCDAHAECGKDALVPGTECPLNTCCSEFGFVRMIRGNACVVTC